MTYLEIFRAFALAALATFVIVGSGTVVQHAVVSMQ
jgi:hypothetical protein